MIPPLNALRAANIREIGNSKNQIKRILRMFTGIVEAQGIVTDIQEFETNKTFWLESPLSRDFKIDQSVAHDGVCLTVEETENNRHRVTAIRETLVKTNLDDWKIGDFVNLERSMQMAGRIDGHIVQGHVDSTGSCDHIVEKQGSWQFTIGFPEDFAALVIEKGSICLNGISLTAFDVSRNQLTVAIIPYTYNNTSINRLKLNDRVNLEFDIIGKYIQRWREIHQ